MATVTHFGDWLKAANQIASDGISFLDHGGLLEAVRASQAGEPVFIPAPVSATENHYVAVDPFGNPAEAPSSSRSRTVFDLSGMDSGGGASSYATPKTRPVQKIFTANADLTGARQHARAIFSAAARGECDATALSAFAAEIATLIPVFEEETAAALKAGHVAIADVRALFAKISELRSFGYEGVASLAELDAKLGSVDSAEFKTLTRSVAVLRELSGDLRYKSKRAEDIDLDVYRRESIAKLEASAAEAEALVEKFTPELARQVSEFVAGVRSLAVRMGEVQDADVAKIFTEMSETSKNIASQGQALAMPLSNEKLKKSLRATVLSFTEQLDKFLPAVFDYEQELMSWSVLNAVGVNIFDREEYWEALRFIGNYYSDAVARDRLVLDDLSPGLRLTAVRERFEFRAMMANGMILADEKKPRYHNDKPDGVADRIPLFDRKTGDYDNAYRNAGKPPRYYDVALGTALTWFLPDGTDKNSNPNELMVLPEDLGVVPFSHGTSAFYSNSSATLGAAAALMHEETPDGPKRIFSSIAYDVFSHGFGPRLRLPAENPADAERIRAENWRFENAVLSYLATLGPIATFGRSYGADKALEMPLRGGAELIRGAWAMSPYPASWVAYTMAALSGHGIQLNDEGDLWSSYIDAEWLWEKDENIGAQGVPILITYSPDDIEYPPEELKTYWKARYAGAPGHLIAVFPGGAHNLFDTANMPIFRAARRLGQWWLKEIFKGNSDPQVPQEILEDLQHIKEGQIRSHIKIAFFPDPEKAHKLLVELPESLQVQALGELEARVRQDIVNDLLAADEPKTLAKKLRDEIWQSLGGLVRAELLDAVVNGVAMTELPASLKAKLQDFRAQGSDEEFATFLNDGRINRRVPRELKDELGPFLRERLYQRVARLYTPALKDQLPERLHSALEKLEQKTLESHVAQIVIQGAGEGLLSQASADAVKAFVAAEIQNHRVSLTGNVLVFGRE